MTRTAVLLALFSAAAVAIGCGGPAGQGQLPDRPLPAFTKGQPGPTATAQLTGPAKPPPAR